MAGILCIIKSIRHNYNKEKSKLKVNATLEEVTYRRHLPEGDSPIEQLKELQKPVHDQLVWINEVAEQLQDSSDILDKRTYNRFLETLFASMYVFSVQGRVNALQTLQYRHGEELYAENVVLSTQLKTRRSFGYQPILVDEDAKHLFNLYWNVFRPIVASTDMCEPTSPLWLEFSGKPCKSFGAKLSNFYLYSQEINISTNRIRSLVETATNSLHQ